MPQHQRRASATNMKLFQHAHQRAATFPAPSTCWCAWKALVLLFFKDYQRTAKAEQLGIFRRQKWTFLSRKVNDNLCKKIFSFGYFFSSFIIFWINNYLKVRHTLQTIDDDGESESFPPSSATTFFCCSFGCARKAIQLASGVGWQYRAS